MTDQVSHPALTRPEGFVTEEQEWGRLVWMVNAALGSSQTLTVGKCFLNVGQANPRHFHSNCDEVLHVLRGDIENSIGDDVFPMTAGDIVSIPQGSVHNARNIGTETAELLIMYNSAYRQSEGE